MFCTAAGRDCVRVASWGVVSLVVLAGCAAGEKGGSGAVAEKSAAAAKPTTYAVIDGKREAVPAIAMGDAATIARIIEEGKNHNQVMEHLAHLSTDIGPRLTGSTNVETANKWCRDQFEKWGLTIPAFGGSEGQSSGDPELRGLWQWGSIAVRFDRGPSSGKVLAIRNPGSDTPEYRTVREAELTTMSWAPGTNGAVRGKVVKMPENDEQFEAVKDSIKGSWVLVKPGQPGRRGVVGGASARQQLFREIRKVWKDGAAPAADAPAVDTSITHYAGSMSGGPIPDAMAFTLDLKLADPKAVTGTFSIGGFRTSEIQSGTLDESTGELKFKTESSRGVREYVMKLEGDTVKGKTDLPDNGGTISYSGTKVAQEASNKGPGLEERVLKLEPAGWVLPASGELVLTGGAPGWDKLDLDAMPPDVIVTVRASDYDCMNSRLADGVPVEAEFDLKNTLKKGPFAVYNTIAEIRGTEKPDEVVIVSGHLDSWDGPGSRGTTDNGTGSSVTLEAARLLAAAKAKPKRTIRFVLWTGEEQGLLGSVAYVKHLKEKGELAKMSAVLVDDGGTNYEGGLPCVASQVPYLAAATAPVNGHFYSETDKKYLDVNIHATKTFTQVMGSDHNSFMREKIPGFFWDEEGRADYDYTHHTQHDHLSAAIPEYLKQSATCMAVTAYNLACAPDMLARPTDEEWPQRGGGGGRQGGGNRAGGAGGAGGGAARTGGGGN